MGQALRRASGRIRPSTAAASPSARPPPPQPKRAAETSPSVSGAGAAGPPPQDQLGVSDSDTTVPAKDGYGSVLEDRDPNYDTMLGFMVGRITTKPGGKAEMGEASIKDRYNRPLPKVRSSKVNGDNAHQSLTPGTLSVEHIRQIILLHQGKSDGQQGPMTNKDIAKRFQVDVTMIETIVQSISLPEEDTNKKSKE